MRTAQQGDRAQVHYVIRSQDGSQVSSRGRAPLELTVGVPHSRLPGLGLALVGMAAGTRTTVRVRAEQAFGTPDPSRVRRCSRQRFPQQAALAVGKLVRLSNARGRRRLVRILRLGSKMVLVDVNHPWAGQSLELEVELLALASEGEPLNEEQGRHRDPWRDDGGEG
jgi:FKBP-type peptidyl-prolyl cis-trans isomerase 2